MNFKQHWIDLFIYYEEDPTMVSRLTLDELETIVGRILFNKRNLSDSCKQFRAACQKELERRVAEIRKHELAKVQSEGIHHELAKDFDDVEYYWKNIRDLREKHRYKRADELLKKRGRKVGQVLYDYTPLPTNLYSVGALLNIYNGKAKENTGEHFMSLHSNAGPLMLEEAISIGIKYDIHHYALAVYKNIHTVITTKHENVLLQQYHTNNKMITPQTSYDAVGMAILVDVPKPPTRTKLAWHYLFKNLEVEPKIPHPFTNVLPLECVVEKYLDIDAEKLKAALKIA